MDTIAVTVPSDWQSGICNAWSSEAAEILEDLGAVALVCPEDDADDGLIEHEICDNASRAAFLRVEEMQDRIANRGLDPSGIDEPFRFAEIVCRDEGGRRFDVPLPWLGNSDSEDGAEMNDRADQRSTVGSERMGAPLHPEEEEAISELHKSMKSIVTPVVDAMWSRHDDNESDESISSNRSYIAAAGFLMNKPGSKSQNWHRDGPDEGYIDCFVPLIDLDESVGPTAIQPGTHTDRMASSTGKNKDDDGSNNVLVPLLNKGDILLFDYRTIHKGQGNTSKSTTRTLAYTVFRKKEEAQLSSNIGGDIHNFPAALTLEYD